MDLNAKIEARRREKAEEARNIDKIEKEKKESQKLEIKKEAARRLESMGISVEPAIKTELPEKDIEQEVQKALDKAASERMTGSETAKLAVLSVLGIAMLFMAWPIGLALLIWAVVYYSKKIKRYKAEIIAEGEKRKKIKSGDLVVRSVFLISLGEQPEKVRAIVGQMTNLGINDTNDLVGKLPCVVLSDVPIANAEDAKVQLSQAGAIVEIQDYRG